MVLNMSQYVFLFVNVNGWQKLFVNAMAHNLNMWWWSAWQFLGLQRPLRIPNINCLSRSPLQPKNHCRTTVNTSNHIFSEIWPPPTHSLEQSLKKALFCTFPNANRAIQGNVVMQVTHAQIQILITIEGNTIHSFSFCTPFTFPPLLFPFVILFFLLITSSIVHMSSSLASMGCKPTHQRWKDEMKWMQRKLS